MRTAVGHKPRETSQQFATEAVERYQPADVETSPALVNRRLDAVAVFLGSTVKGALTLILLAVGELHPTVTWRPSVYQVADRRLNS